MSHTHTTTEVIAVDHRTNLSATLTALAWSQTCYAYLEHIPTKWMGNRGSREGLQLIQYNPGTPFNQWQRGRIFDATQELKWEWFAGKFHLVYCGPNPPDGLTERLTVTGAQQRAYFTWGTRVPDDNRKALGIAQTESAYIELQIPRVLHYPVDPTSERVKIGILEWYAPDGRLLYSRWNAVLPVP
jgi:hypothetical protein